MKNLNEYSITVFGDSISKGVAFEHGKFVYLNDNAVKIVSQTYNANIDNRSNIGQTFSKLYERGVVKRYIDGVDTTKNNCVVFSIGGNDSDYDWKTVVESPRAKHLEKTPLNKLEYMLNDTVLALKNKGVKVVFTTLTPVDSTRYFKSISKIADGDKIMEFLRGDVSNISRHQECYNNVVVKCAMKNNCKLLDTRSGFLMNKGYLKYLCADGIHPNGLGQKKIAEEIITQLEA